MLQPAMRSTSRLSSTNGTSSASASCRPRVDLPAPRRPTRAMRRPRAPAPPSPNTPAERQPGAAQLGVALAAQQLAQHQPLRRAGGHVADQLGERAVERVRDLLQHQDRGVADAVFEVGEMPLGDARGGRDRLAGQAAARPQQPDALAQGEEKGILVLSGHTCSIVLDMDISPPEPLNFAQHLFQANAGRAAKIAYVDDRGSLSYGELEERSRRFAAALLGARHPARGARAAADARRQRVADRLPRLPLRRHRAGGGEHAAHRRRLRLHAGAQPGPGGDRLGLARAAARQGDGPGEERGQAPDRRRRRRDRCRPARSPSIRSSPPASRSPSPPRPAATIRRSGCIRRARPASPRARSTPTPTPGGPPSCTASGCSA